MLPRAEALRKLPARNQPARHPAIREVLIVALWILPVAIVATVLGILFLWTFENSRHPLYGPVGYVAIPAVVGFGAFAVALWKRPRAKRWSEALLVRPVALYVLLAAIGAWLVTGADSEGFGLVAPLAVAPVVASLASICAVVACARPRSGVEPVLQRPAPPRADLDDNVPRTHVGAR